MKKFFLSTFAKFLNAIYRGMKKEPGSEQVTILSRQSDSETLDISMLRHELENRGVKVNVLCRKLRFSIPYFIYTLKQMRFIAGSKVAVVDSYCVPICIIRDKHDLKVVQIWHALSAIKMFGRQTIDNEEGYSHLVAEQLHMHENYDYIIAPSEVTATHFGKAFGYDRDHFVMAGLPRIDYILAVNGEKVREIKEVYGLNNGKKTILYVPTFRRTEKTDVASFTGAMDCGKYNLLVRLHPLDDSPVPEGEGIIKADKFDSYDLLKAADMVVTDYSSFAVEASLLDKPLYIYAYDMEEYERKNGLNVRFADEAIGKYTYTDAVKLAAAMEEPYNLQAVRDFRNKYIEVDTHACTEGLADFVEELLHS